MDEDTPPAPVPPKPEPPPHRSLLHALPPEFDPERFDVDAGKIIPPRHYWDPEHRQVIKNGYLWDPETGTQIKPQDRATAVKGKRRATSGRRKINGNSPTNPRQLKIALQAQKAVKLRIQGYTFSEIAEACDYNSPQAAHAAIRAVLNRATDELSDREMIAISLARIERMFQAVAPAAFQGHVASIARCQDLINQELRIAGALHPNKGETQPMDIGKPVDIMSIISRAHETIGEREGETRRALREEIRRELEEEMEAERLNGHKLNGQKANNNRGINGDGEMHRR